MTDGEGSRFYGKFRAVVSRNDDPAELGRVRARVRAFRDEECAWALPALPFAGPGVGLYLIPPVGAWVWIEYERGDRSSPIWTGCFWSDTPVPDPGRLRGARPGIRMLRTKAATVTVDDTNGSLVVETADGRISVTSQAVEVTNGTATVRLSGSKVSINDDALEVT